MCHQHFNKKPISKNISRIDFDKNRLIDTKEMNKWMSRHIKKHYDLAKSKTEQMFQFMDTDKDSC
jgi:hypothetical protein